VWTAGRWAAAAECCFAALFSFSCPPFVPTVPTVLLMSDVGDECLFVSCSAPKCFVCCLMCDVCSVMCAPLPSPVQDGDEPTSQPHLLIWAGKWKKKKRG
jgi:hypothetical protein